MEPDQVRRRTFCNRGAVHGPPLIWSRTKYGAGPNNAASLGTSTPLKSWRRRWSGSNKGPDHVRRRTFEIVAPYMVRLQYRAGPSTAPVSSMLCRLEHLLHRNRGAVHGPDAIGGRTMYGAGRLKIVAPYMVRMPTITPDPAGVRRQLQVHRRTKAFAENSKYRPPAAQKQTLRLYCEW